VTPRGLKIPVGSVIPAAVAIARVIEARVRRSKRAARAGRLAMAAFGRVSPEARAVIRLRLMKLV
jgi:hypothetical protein